MPIVHKPSLAWKPEAGTLFPAVPPTCLLTAGLASTLGRSLRGWRPSAFITGRGPLHSYGPAPAHQHYRRRLHPNLPLTPTRTKAHFKTRNVKISNASS